MLRFKKNILNCIISHGKQSVRCFSTPTIPEYADVVIIGTCYKENDMKIEIFLSIERRK